MFYRFLVRPLLFRLDPERAHRLALGCLARWRLGGDLCESVLAVDRPELRTEVYGLSFRNPVGLAAGFDKDATAVKAWQHLGFGFCELGTVTPRPQPGNPRQRVFRLTKDRALYNRLGFNSLGAPEVARRLHMTAPVSIPIGISLGKNADTSREASLDDYLETMSSLGDYADYFALNVSSPNTEGLRDLQHPRHIGTLVREATAAAGRLSRKPPILVKISPDLPGNRWLEGVLDEIVAAGGAGVIATNTTISQEGLRQGTRLSKGGGISGAPLREVADEVVRRIYRHCGSSLPIIGVGGIFSARDAYRRLRCGASLVQVYTGLVYEGPLLAHRINRGVSKLLAQDGYSTVEEAVGTLA